MKYLTFILLTTIIVSCKTSKSAECDAYGKLLNDYLNISTGVDFARGGWEGKGYQLG